MSKNPAPLKGEIWFVRIPNQPHDSHQPRTAIVVSTNGRNRHANDVMVVPTTSSKNFKPHASFHVSLPKGEGGLSRDSYARCDQLTTIHKDLLADGPLGEPIHSSYRGLLLNAIRRALGDPSI